MCITARKPDELDEAVRSLDPDGTGRAIAARGSADDEEHQAGAVAPAVERFGRLDLLVNNAAVNPQYGPAHRRRPRRGAQGVRGQRRRGARLDAAGVAAWLAEHGGAVLNVASVGGLRAGSPIGAYNASKAAVIHLTRQLARRARPEGAGQRASPRPW